MSQAPNTASQTGSAASSSTTSTLSIPATAAAGGLTITQPPQTATSFYKIATNELVTFGWNMTSVIATPSTLTVSAVCENGITYPVGQVPGTATQIVWDVYSYQQANPNTPLAQASYTLEIFDERGLGAQARGGFMSPNTALKFALYTPQAYTPISSGWQCTGCSSAPPSFVAHPAFIGLVVTFFVVVFSGLHVFRHTVRP